MKVCPIIAHSAVMPIPRGHPENTRVDCDENYVCQNYTDWIGIENTFRGAEKG